ncbi:MAG: translation initiation factor IF-2 [Desulfovibrionaceae bacterium]|nr:translation initiation factor IF-2 [Desulfovibrionaceae bacterium]
MTAKIRVKDLAAELGIGNKDILQLLREQGVQVKSHMSGLEPEEADRVRLEARQGGEARTEVVRREVEPGIIVRRRRVAPAAPKEAAPEVPAAEPKAKARKTVKKAVPTEPEAAAEAAEKPVPEVPEAKTPEAVEAGPEAEQEAEKKGKTAKKKTERKADKEPQAPQVRIISMPTPGEAVEAKRPRRPLRPVAPLVPEQPAMPAPAPEAEAGKAKKKKKDRRVVEFAPLDDGLKKGRRRPAPGMAEEAFRGKPKRKRQRSAGHEAGDEAGAGQPVKAAKRKLKVDETIRVSDMARQMGIKAPLLIKALFDLGVLATINQALDMDTATLLAAEFGYEVENVSFDEQEFLVPAEQDSPEALKPRPPVVTIMGHVDHGKTSLLDAIRKTNITAGEAGGITQHIGAYHVSTNRGDVVFLDTPGHEAFTTMRARGAQVTDIVILVVAADDGVMDQTREAINHSKAAGVPIVVAVNKIDKENADPDRVKRELSELGLVPEDWGGDTIFAKVSAKQRIGLDELLEMILLQAEVLELKANPDKPARGHIVEAKLDKGRGPLATLLISEGTIKQGDSFVCGVFHGKVRALFNDQGKKIKKAGPAMPVEIQGFEGVPEAGDEFAAVADEKVARRIAQERLTKHREKELAGKTKVTLESFLASKPEEEAQVLNLVLKADVQGSLEAIAEALNKLSTDEVKMHIVHGAAGAIAESDILLASASKAIIIGFNVRPTHKVKDIADQEHVEIRFYDIIYKLVSDIKDAMSGMLAPDIEESYLGQAEVRDTFSVPKVGTVAGCFVADGRLTRNAKVRLLRDGVVIYTGRLSSLKRFKDDVKEVQKDYECGVALENFNDLKIGDFIEAFEEREVARTLE